MDEFYTTIEIAKKLKICKKTVLRLIEEGKIKAYRIGRRMRVRREDFDKYLDDMQVRRTVKRDETM